MRSINSMMSAKRFAFFGVIAVAGYGAILFFGTAFLRFYYPYLVGLGEAPLSQAIRLFYEGKLPYRDLASPPYTLVPYGPVYPVFSALAKIFFGSPFTGGRFLTFLTSLGAAGLIYLILRQTRVRKSFAFLSALFFLSMPYVNLWGVMVNVDMMGVCFDLAAFYLWWRWVDEDFKSRKLLICGVLFSTAAFFTKSSMVAAPAALFCFLVFQKHFKHAALLLFFEAALAGCIYFLLYAVTQGGYFFHTTYEISRRGFFPVLILYFWKGALTDAPLLATVSLLGLWGAVRSKKKLFFSLYLLFTLLLTISLGKQGSDTNYLLQWCAVSITALGMALQYFFGAEAGGKRWAVAEWVVYLLLLGQLSIWIYPQYNFKHTREGYRNSRVFFDGISRLVQKAPGDILSEDMSLIVANGKEIFYEPFPMGQMSYSGIWDEGLILKKMDQCHFSMAILYFYAPILIRNRTFTPAFMKKFNEKYVFVGRAVPPENTASLATHPLFFYAPRKE